MIWFLILFVLLSFNNCSFFWFSLCENKKGLSSRSKTKRTKQTLFAIFPEAKPIYDNRIIEISVGEWENTKKELYSNELRELSTEEIQKKIVETKEEVFNLRFQQATGTLEKPSRIRELRHTVARMKTVLKEREVNE